MQAADVCVYTACLAACTQPLPEADFAACQKAAVQSLRRQGSVWAIAALRGMQLLELQRVLQRND
jgi:hypothetical protein